MLNYAHFRASFFSTFWIILQCFASKTSKNTEKLVYLEALLMAHELNTGSKHGDNISLNPLNHKLVLDLCPQHQHWRFGGSTSTGDAHRGK